MILLSSKILLPRKKILKLRRVNQLIKDIIKENRIVQEQGKGFRSINLDLLLFHLLLKEKNENNWRFEFNYQNCKHYISLIFIIYTLFEKINIFRLYLIVLYTKVLFNFYKKDHEKFNYIMLLLILIILVYFQSKNCLIKQFVFLVLFFLQIIIVILNFIILHQLFHCNYLK